MNEKVKKGLKLGGNRPNLTTLEKEILRLLTEEYMTVSKIASMRGCSLNAVYKVRKKLLSKGFINSINATNFPSETQVEKIGGGVGGVPFADSENINKIRLHGEQYHLNVILKTPFYQKLLKNGSYKLNLNGNTIMCYPNSVEVYSNTSFLGDTANESDSKAMDYWTRFFITLETKLKTILVKNGHFNITRVKAEFAETNNELAESTLKENEKIRIISNDGKAWLIIDNSFNLAECETVHPKTSKQDMQNVVQPFFTDLRDNDCFMPSQTKIFIEETQKQISDVAKELNTLVKTVSTLVNLHMATQQQTQPDQKIEDNLPDYFG